MDLRELALHWYALLSTLNASVASPLSAIDRSINVPIVSAVLSGLLVATAPSQLTTNARGGAGDPGAMIDAHTTIRDLAAFSLLLATGILRDEEFRLAMDDMTWGAMSFI